MSLIGCMTFRNGVGFGVGVERVMHRFKEVNIYCLCPKVNIAFCWSLKYFRKWCILMKVVNEKEKSQWNPSPQLCTCSVSALVQIPAPNPQWELACVSLLWIPSVSLILHGMFADSKSNNNNNNNNQNNNHLPGYSFHFSQLSYKALRVKLCLLDRHRQVQGPPHRKS